MSTPYSTQANKENTLQIRVTECQRDIENIKWHMSLIENTLSFTGLSITEMNELEDSLREYKADLVKAENSLDEALDALLGEEDEPLNWWEQEETPDLWSNLLR